MIREFGIALLVISGATGPGCAQLCDERVVPAPIDASGVWVLNEDGPLGYTTGGGEFTPDRRPIFMIQPFSGGKRVRTNPFGFRTEFAFCDDKNQDGVIDAQAWILGEFEKGWNMGFRRFIIERPGGTLAGNTVEDCLGRSSTHVQQEMFEHLENWRKKIYVEAVAGWIAQKRAIDPDTEVGVFIGSRQNNASNPCHTPAAGEGVYNCAGTDASATREMNASVRRSAELTYQSTRPWIDAGYNAFWFDASANPLAGCDPENGVTEPQSIVAMRDNPDYAGVKIAGEALPNRRLRSGGHEPVDEYTRAAAWIGDQRFFEMTGMNALAYDPDTTEVVSAFIRSPANAPNPHPPCDIRVVATYRDHGFVLAAWGGFGAPWIQRVDDTLDDTLTRLAILDFNADGRTECDDWELFHANWQRNRGRSLPSPAVWDGDIDDDGDIDRDDRDSFEADWRGAGLPACG